MKFMDSRTFWLLFMVLWFPGAIALIFAIGYTLDGLVYLKNKAPLIIRQVNRSAKDMVVNNAKKIQQQINQAHNMTVNNYGKHTTHNHYHTPVKTADDMLLENLLHSTATDLLC